MLADRLGTWETLPVDSLKEHDEMLAKLHTAMKEGLNILGGEKLTF